jgi:hypothetical protein
MAKYQVLVKLVSISPIIITCASPVTSIHFEMTSMGVLNGGKNLNPDGKGVRQVKK